MRWPAPAGPQRILPLDSSIPDDYIIDKRHGFNGMCLTANRQADAYQSPEKIDNCRLSKWAYDRRDQQPHVPLIYLAAKILPTGETSPTTRSGRRSPTADRRALGIGQCTALDG